MNEIISIYIKIKDRIDERLAVFDKIKSETEEEHFTELVFCLLTPQTKARQAEKAVNLLKSKNLIFSGNAEDLSKVLNIVRFRNHKANYIIEARKTCAINGKPAVKAILSNIPTVYEKREWLIDNVKGMGFKEASHFLRNTGYGNDIAILDRHIVRNLVRTGVLPEETMNLSGKNYYEIEKKMAVFSDKIGIPMIYLDFVLWYKETGDIFK